MTTAASGDLERLEAVHAGTGRGSAGSAFEKLEDRLAEPQADRGVDGDPGRGQEPDVRASGAARRTGRGPSVGPSRPRAAARSLGVVAVLDAVAVDQERHAVERRVQEERGGAEGREQERRDRRSPTPMPGQRRPLEPCRGLAPEDLVAGGRRARCSRGSTGRSRRSTRPRGAACRRGASRFVVRPVRITATAPNTGPNSMTRWWPSRSDRTPKIGERTSSASVERRRGGARASSRRDRPVRRARAASRGRRPASRP